MTGIPPRDPLRAFALDPRDPTATSRAQTEDPVVLTDDSTANARAGQVIAIGFMALLSLTFLLLVIVTTVVALRAGTYTVQHAVVGVACLFWSALFGAVVVLGRRGLRTRRTGYVTIGSRGIVSNHYDVRTRTDRRIDIAWEQVQKVGTILRWAPLPRTWLLPLPRRFKTQVVTTIRLAPSTLGIDDGLRLPIQDGGPFTHGIGLLHPMFVDARTGTPAVTLANLALQRFAGPRYVAPEVVEGWPRRPG